jgi:hypothetical protein
MPQMLGHSTLNRLEFSRLFLAEHGNTIFKFSLFVTVKSFFSIKYSIDYYQWYYEINVIFIPRCRTSFVETFPTV